MGQRGGVMVAMSYISRNDAFGTENEIEKFTKCNRALPNSDDYHSSEATHS